MCSNFGISGVDPPIVKQLTNYKGGLYFLLDWIFYFFKFYYCAGSGGQQHVPPRLSVAFRPQVEAGK